MFTLPKTLQKQVQQWLTSAHQEVPLLLIGRSNTQWDSLLQYVRQLVVCTNKSRRPCGVCAACKQAAANQHPNVVTVAPDTKTITIKQIRSLLPQLHRTTSGKRLIIIPAAHRLLPVAANALLKELEESSAQNRFLLTTSYPGRLLPTIVSRCSVLRLSGQPEVKDEEKVSLTVLMSQLSGRRLALSQAELDTIARTLQITLNQEGPSPRLFRALLRLRDYYKIRSRRGNEKLSADVLLASLRQLSHNSQQKELTRYANR